MNKPQFFRQIILGLVWVLLLGTVLLSTAPPKPDLVVSISCPETAFPGMKLRNLLKVKIKNMGASEANNFHVEIILSRNMNIPDRKAAYSPNFRDDVLLQDGREHIASLKPNETFSLRFSGSNKIPDDAPLGDLYLGAVVDPGKKVSEQNENNNTSRCLISLQMVIDEIHQHEGLTDTEIDIMGDGFGPAAGSRKINIGSRKAGIIKWAPKYITVSPPAGIAYGKTHTLFVSQGTKTVSNIYDFFLYRWIDTLDPEEGSPGAKIEIKGAHLGSSQGTRELKIGEYRVNQVFLWDGSHIQCRIPNRIPPGLYKIRMYENGQIVSNDKEYIIKKK